MSNIIEVRNICKSFGNVHALRGVDFTLKRAEIAALLGDNGAGKSTLIKVISGLYPPEQGTFLFGGENINFKKFSVAAARKAGIETVHQDRALGLKQSLWRNLFMGRHITNSFGIIDVKREREIARRVIEQLGLSAFGISPDTLAGVLSGGERQGLAIGRAMYFDAEVVIMDEPTTALAVTEVEHVLNFIRGIKQKGRSVILITHSIDHAWNISDRFVIMSHGKIFGEWKKRDLTLEKLLDKLREGCR